MFDGVTVAFPWPGKGENIGTYIRSSNALGINLAIANTPWTLEALRHGSRIPLEELTFDIEIFDEDPVEWVKAQRDIYNEVIALEVGSNHQQVIPIKNMLPLYSGGLIIIGHERKGKGVFDEVLDLCDYVVEIPMPAHDDNSLNVAVTASMILYKATGMI